MFKMRSLLVAGVVLGVLVFGVTTVHGIWWWNAKFDVGGSMISTRWSVNDPNGSQDYHASITLTLPRDAGDVRIIAQKRNETVDLQYSKKLKCSGGKMQARVQYNVVAQDDGVGGVPDGDRVRVRVVTRNRTLASGEGDLGKDIGLKFKSRCFLAGPSSSLSCSPSSLPNIIRRWGQG